MLPVEGEVFRMTLWRIDCMGRDPRFTGAGGVKSPFFVPFADGKISVESGGAGFHATTESLMASRAKSTFQVPCLRSAGL